MSLLRNMLGSCFLPFPSLPRICNVECKQFDELFIFLLHSPNLHLFFCFCNSINHRLFVVPIFSAIWLQCSVHMQTTLCPVQRQTLALTVAFPPPKKTGLVS